MRIQAGLPTGVSALLGGRAKERRALEQVLARELEARGFDEVILPVLDYFEPYEALLTSGSSDSLYRFVDRDGQLLAVRSDFTPMLARILAPLLEAPGDPVVGGGIGEPIRLFYRGDVVRFQESRPGRLREHYQLGAEILRSTREAPASSGDPAEKPPSLPSAKAQSLADEQELLELFLELLVRSFESRDATSSKSQTPSQTPSQMASERPPVRVVFGCAGALDQLLQGAGVKPSRLAQALVKRDRETVRQGPPALLQVLEHGMPNDLAALGGDSAERVARLQTLISAVARVSPPGFEFGIDLAEYATNNLDPTLGIEDHSWRYYDGIVFRAYTRGSATSVGQGGRYDRLFSALSSSRSGNPGSTTAVGFSLGVDRILSQRRAGESFEGGAE
jgi:ATP phosphoribosyltransferase regulatory subunit